MILIRGTTPSIKYIFNKVNAADITTAYLTIEKESGQPILELTLNDAVVDAEANTYIVDGDATIVVTIGGGGSTEALYLKVNGQWPQVSAAYLKVNGQWVQQTSLSELFNTGTNYVKRN